MTPILFGKKKGNAYQKVNNPKSEMTDAIVANGCHQSCGITTPRSPKPAPINPNMDINQITNPTKFV